MAAPAGLHQSHRRRDPQPPAPRIQYHPAALRLDGPARTRAEGIKMGELSKRMMVTGGNVTGITDQLVGEGLVKREDNPMTGAPTSSRLTPKGRKLFGEMGHRSTKAGSSNCSAASMPASANNSTACWPSSSAMPARSPPPPQPTKPHETRHTCAPCRLATADRRSEAGRPHHAQSARSARIALTFAILHRITRPVPRTGPASICITSPGTRRSHQRSRWQLLLGRRCARHHRPAHPHGACRSSSNSRA
jgi:DNA-binding MarR family transcriptional regulator